jgi:outer membrane protein insertion porin family
MNRLSIIFGLIVLCFITSCSVKNKIPKGTYLYNGAKVKVEKAPDNKNKAKPIRKSLEKISAPKKNKMIFGFPYKVAIWYAVGEPKKQSGFKYWLRNRLGEAPVLSTTVDLESNAANMQAYLENKGFFKSRVGADKKIKGYKMTALYTAKVPRPYDVDSVKWVLDSSELSKDLMTIKNRRSYIKKGQQFDIENIKAERNRVDLFLKRKGYYYFSPDYIKSYIDTGKNNHKLNVYLTVKKDIPLNARFPQTINAVVLFPNYSLVNPPPDTSKRGLIKYDSIFIRDTVNDFKPKALVRPLTYRPGSLYNLNKHNQTLNRYINMGVFKFVKSRYVSSEDTVAPRNMDVYYYLTPMKKKTISAEIGGFTKSNSFTGAQLNLNWKNRNLLKGAEQLNIKGYGAFELSINDSLSKNNNWRVGGEISLAIPRFVTPFKIKESSYFPPFTKFTIGYEWLRRQLLYTKNFFRFQYDLNWKEGTNKEHTLSPISITYNNATEFSDEYIQQITKFPVLRYANLPEIIAGSFYNFMYNSKNPRAKNIVYLNGSLDVAGNIAGLVNKPDSAFDKTFLSAYFAQYAKLDVDFRYTRKISNNFYWANRINVGWGLPYGNSVYLPFSRQFIIGGGNSLRGFRPRQVGPGRAITTPEQQVAYPQVGGDYKLELQSEIRFPILGKLKGAFFGEAGNIWTKNSILYGDDGKFSSKFMQDLAVDGGFGIRLDISVLILRLDVGIPLRKPWLPKGSEWVVNQIDFGSSSWRSDNLVFNIGIGYPF